jgi:hypothetical protein
VSTHYYSPHRTGPVQDTEAAISLVTAVLGGISDRNGISKDRWRAAWMRAFMPQTAARLELKIGWEALSRSEDGS